MTQTLLEELNIRLDPDAKVAELSVANRQMVEIAKAVSYKSDVLIMDEPTSALTQKEADHLFAIIRDLRAQGVGIVYITHKMNELSRSRMMIRWCVMHAPSRPTGLMGSPATTSAVAWSGANSRPCSPRRTCRSAKPGSRSKD
jgi:ABC-type sugar transport system ATPase subunit